MMKKQHLRRLALLAAILLATLTLLAPLSACTRTQPPDNPEQPEQPSGPQPPVEDPTVQGNVRLSNEELYDKTAGSWVGQMIGVSWSASTEFRYCSVIIPEGDVPLWTPAMVNDAFGQDDLYVEVPFLDAMKQEGVDATIDEIAPYFRDSRFALAHANYQGRINLREGIAPALAGHYRYNYHADDIDWQIEADFLGNIFPALPSLAAQRAFEIGHLVNYGDGVYGGVFVAAMHAAAFMTDNLREVIDAGITAVPEGSKFRAICDQVVACYDEGMSWEECWQCVETDWATDDKCPEGRGAFNIDAKINAAYILIGLLWGEGDFTDTMLISMRCGQDSDCNPSSAAAVLGTMYGLSGIPEEYKRATDFDGATFAYTDYTLNDCIELNVELAKQALLANGAVELDGVWHWNAPDGVTPVALEQWPDDELTVYMTLSARNTGMVNIKTACVVPEGYSHADVSYTIDMGDGIQLPSLVSSYQYLTPGVYTIKCTATVGEHTASVERTVDLQELRGDRGFKITASCSETAPAGGGSRDISVIIDGEIPSADVADHLQQYDTFGGSASDQHWFALKFDHTVTVTDVLFTEGSHFENGGWFAKTPAVDMLIDGKWQRVSTNCSPLYIEVDAMASQGDPYQTFTFTPEQPIACRGIRVIGTPGGSSDFVSCAELDIRFSDVVDPTYGESDPSDPVSNAVILLSESNPSGAGCKNIEIIRDKTAGQVGSSGNHGTLQYDTFTGSATEREDYYGYLFRAKANVASVTFTEGVHFDNGGWFKDGTLHLELLLDGEWVDADATVSPKYPTGDRQETFGANYQSYTFTLSEAVRCDGIRVIGMAGGSAHFTSISELSVTVE